MNDIAVDSSVLVAIVKEEPEEQAFLSVLLQSHSFIAGPTVFETRIWLLRHGRLTSRRWLDNWLGGRS